jgi:hypothetical protein
MGPTPFAAWMPWNAQTRTHAQEPPWLLENRLRYRGKRRGRRPSRPVDRTSTRPRDSPEIHRTTERSDRTDVHGGRPLVGSHPHLRVGRIRSDGKAPLRRTITEVGPTIIHRSAATRTRMATRNRTSLSTSMPQKVTILANYRSSQPPLHVSSNRKRVRPENCVPRQIRFLARAPTVTRRFHHSKLP